jgi:hypothetical protein
VSLHMFLSLKRDTLKILHDAYLNMTYIYIWNFYLSLTLNFKSQECIQKYDLQFEPSLL